MKNSISLVSLLGCGFLFLACGGYASDMASEQSEGPVVVYETETVYVPVTEVVEVHDTETVYVPEYIYVNPPVAPAPDAPAPVSEEPVLSGMLQLSTALHAKGVQQMPQGAFGNFATMYACVQGTTDQPTRVAQLPARMITSLADIGTNIEQCSTHGWPATDTCQGTAMVGPDGELTFALENCTIPAIPQGDNLSCVFVDIDCKLADDAPTGQTFAIEEMTWQRAQDAVLLNDGELVGMGAGQSTDGPGLVTEITAAPVTPTHIVSLVYANHFGSSYATMPMLRFTVTADASADFSFTSLTSELVQEIAESGVTIDVTNSTSSVRRVGDSINIGGDASLLDADGNDCSSDSGPCTFIAVFAQPEVVAAGTSRTYDVRLTFGGASVTDEDFVQLSLPTVQ